MIRNYIRHNKRRECSKRLLVAKAIKRMERGVDADTLRSRALWDAQHNYQTHR